MKPNRVRRIDDQHIYATVVSHFGVGQVCVIRRKIVLRGLCKNSVNAKTFSEEKDVLSVGAALEPNTKNRGGSNAHRKPVYTVGIITAKFVSSLAF